MKPSTNMRQFITYIEPKSVLSHHFNDTKPNYFVVTNYGNTDVYFAVNNYPTEDLYDMKIAPGDQRIYGEPIFHSDLYILNPDSSPARVKCISVETPFDISTFAMSVMAESFGASLADVTISTDGQVKGFQASLPSGTNHIGEVSVDLASLEPLLGKRRGAQTVIAHNGEPVMETRYNVTYINFITNDHETNDITVRINTQTLTLKAGETLQDVELNDDTVSISGSSFRALILKY